MDDEVVLLEDSNIFELGFVSSLFAMKLLNYLENEFEITIENEDIDISNFNSISNIIEFIEKKIS